MRSFCSTFNKFFAFRFITQKKKKNIRIVKYSVRKCLSIDISYSLFSHFFSLKLTDEYSFKMISSKKWILFIYSSTKWFCENLYKIFYWFSLVMLLMCAFVLWASEMCKSERLFSACIDSMSIWKYTKTKKVQ